MSASVRITDTSRTAHVQRLTRTVPAEMRKHAHYVLWRREVAPTPTDPGHTTKTPYIANGKGPLQKAATTRPGEWRSFDLAIAAFQSRDDVDGLGFVLSAADPLTGVDLDHCIDPETGQLAEWAQVIVDSFASYAEVSPSGTGVHIFFQARMPDRQDASGKVMRQAGRKCGPIEAYSNARYLTLTGEHLENTPTTIEPGQEELDRFLARYLPEKPTVQQTRGDGTFARPALALDDQALLAKIKASDQGAKFGVLFSGDLTGKPSESEERMALLSILAWWTQDANQIDRLFRASGRDQAKWDRLSDFEIAKALAWVGPNGYDPNGGSQSLSQGRSQSGAKRRPDGHATTAQAGGNIARDASDADAATPSEPSPLSEGAGEGAPVGGYQEKVGGLYRVKPGKMDEGTGEASSDLIALTNFTAHIVGDVVRDDGAETSRVFDIEAQLCLGRRGVQRFLLPAERFSPMTWPTEYLGAGAVVYPNQQQYARTAIQVLSAAASPDGISVRHVYTHTGWREIDGEWLYLHTGGALGAAGARPDVTVALEGALAHYELPDPVAAEAAEAGALRAAIRVSLDMLNGVGPDEVIFPLYGAIWRAALGEADFTLHVTGGTGAGKTQLAALGQQHYGAEMDAKNLPGSWSSTANALEAMAFHAKDAIATIDDFVATGALADMARMHRDADRLLRGQGNSAGRERMRADTTRRPAMPPRGLIVSTGEDIPRGHSLRARMLIVELAPGALDWNRLTRCQRDAADGKYALALAGYVQWIAGRYDALRAEMRPAAIRDRAAGWVGWNLSAQERHRRTSDATAQLYAALEIFTLYALDAQAITKAEARALLERAGKALEHVAAAQAESQAQSDPVIRFLTLLGSAIASGVAHIASKEYGDVNPAATGRWGWRLEIRGVGENATEEWRPQGRRVGWADGDDLYLDADAAFAAAQALGVPSGDALTITSGALWKRLKDRGLLRSTTPTAQTLKARVTCDGQRRWVIHLSADALSEPGGQSPDQPPDQPPGSNTGAAAANNPPASPSVKNPAIPANPAGDAQSKARASADGWVSGLGSGANGWVSETNPASADAEPVGADASVAGLAGCSAQERAIPLTCARPANCARRTLANGRTVCGLCDTPHPSPGQPAARRNVGEPAEVRA